MNEQIKTEELLAKTPENKKAGFLQRIQKKIANSPYSYLFFAFLIPAIIMYVVYIAMEIHPFGEHSVLVLDLNGQYVYFFEALRNFVRGDASLLYSFSRALGGEFLGIYAYYLASPFSYIVALFPTTKMLEALLVIILLKTGLCGLTFGFYLHKNSLNRNKFIIVAFSVMYALCAYAVVYQNNVMWIDALICLPLITYGIEQLIKFGKYKLFVFSLTTAIMSNFYIGYMICIWVVIYFFYYLISQSPEQNNPRGHKMHYLRSFVRIAFFSAIAVMASAVIILSAYYSLKFGKTEFSNPNWAFTENFKILDYFTKFLPGSYDTVRPAGLPYVYSGVLVLILVPVYFVAKKIPAREKIAALFIILLFSASFIIKPLDLIWHGFQRPNWLNYRQSFMLVFFLLTLAYKGLGNLRQAGTKFLFGVGSIIVIFVAILEKFDSFESYVESDGKLLTLQTIWFTILLAVSFVGLLCLLIKLKSRLKRESVCCAIAALVCIELFCSSLACVIQHDNDVTYSKYDSYNEFLSELRPSVAALEEYDTSFYRYEKTNHRKLNDNMALGIRGLSNSTSTLNASTIRFLHQMGYSSKSHWSKYLGGTPASDALLGIKYVITKEEDEHYERYHSVALDLENALVYENQYALSIAYGVDKEIDSFDMEEHTSHFDRMNYLVDAMLGKNVPDIFVKLPVKSVKLQNLSKATAAGHTKYSLTNEDKAGTITFNFTATTDDEVFVHLPTGYPRDCALTVNGKSKGKILANETERLVSLGSFTPGESVDVKLKLDNTYNNLYIMEVDNFFCYFDKDVFEDVFKQINDTPQAVINEGFTDDNLEGTIKTDKAEQTILTTIPYDEGWHIYLDGEEIEYRKTLDALIAFDIEDAGEHTLKMTYCSKAFSMGLIISICGILLFFAVCIIEYLKKRTTRVLYDDVLWELEDFSPDIEDSLDAHSDKVEENEEATEESDPTENEEDN